MKFDGDEITRVVIEAHSCAGSLCRRPDVVVFMVGYGVQLGFGENSNGCVEAFILAPNFAGDLMQLIEIVARGEVTTRHDIRFWTRRARNLANQRLAIMVMSNKYRRGSHD